jgi:hypothetical protein
MNILIITIIRIKNYYDKHIANRKYQNTYTHLHILTHTYTYLHKSRQIILICEFDKE